MQAQNELTFFIYKPNLFKNAEYERIAKYDALYRSSENANKNKIWKPAEMDSDHVTAWSKGGAPTAPIAKCSASRTIEPKGIDKVYFNALENKRFRNSWQNCGTFEI